MIFRVKKGFTLAEVLITLGIIGIVAAMTLPALILKFRRIQLSNQLKVAYSTINEGFSRMLADEGVTDFGETSKYAAMVASKFNDSNVEIAIFKKYFNALVTVPYEQQVAEGWPAGGNDYTGETCTKFVAKGSTWWLKGKTKCRGLRQQVYKLPNGMIIRTGFFDSYPMVENLGRLKRVYAELTVDVNGEKEPNTFGEDVFSFLIGQDGKLYPTAGIDYAYYSAARLSAADHIPYYYMQNGSDKCETGNGTACAGAVMEHDWDIDYYK